MESGVISRASEQKSSTEWLFADRTLRPLVIKEYSADSFALGANEMPGLASYTSAHILIFPAGITYAFWHDCFRSSFKLACNLRFNIPADL